MFIIDYIIRITVAFDFCDKMGISLQYIPVAICRALLYFEFPWGFTQTIFGVFVFVSPSAYGKLRGTRQAMPVSPTTVMGKGMPNYIPTDYELMR